MSAPAGRQAGRQVAWRPQPGPQSDASAARAWCDELFYGGAVFGGKSDFLLGDFATDVGQGPEWVGILFRRTYPELEELIERSHQIYPQMGATYERQPKTWRWPNGAMLRLRNLEVDDDYRKYMGHHYAWIGWDELPEMDSMTPYHRLKARLRGPAKHKRIRATGNPGGRCHKEVKDYFCIGRWPNGYKAIPDAETHTVRMFIPSRVRDNRIGLKHDPGYVDRLKGLGDPELVRGWLEGDWDISFGAYFSMLRPHEVTVDPFNIPEGWTLFTCMDYGEHNPAWCGILAVDYDDDVWVVDEYYRDMTGGADHARGIKKMIDGCPYIGDRRPKLNLAPHDMWTKRKPGEISQATSPADTFRDFGLYLTRANMERVNGWRNIKDLLYAGRLRFFKGRTEHVLSSLQSVQRDEHDPEDVAKGGDDHGSDGIRYGINHVYKPRRIIRKVGDVADGERVLKQLKELDQPEGRYAA